MRTSFTISVGGAVGNNNNPFNGTLDRLLFTKGALAPEQLDYPARVGLTLRNGNNLTLLWSAAATGYVPQSAGVLLNSGTPWMDLSGSTTSGPTNSLSVTLGTTNQFFRLRKP